MEEIIIKTQKELDNLPLYRKGYIYIEGGTKENPLNLRVNFEKASVIVRGSAYLESMSGSAQIKSMYDSAQIKSMYDSAQIKYMSGSAQIESMYDSAQIKSMYGSAQIESMYGSAQIESMYGSAQIKYMSGSAQIESMSGSAQIEYMSGSAQIESMYGSAQIESMSGSAQIEYMSGSAQIKYMYGSAQIKSMYDSAQIKSMYDSAQIKSMYDSAQIKYMSGSAQIESMSGSAQIEYMSGSAQIKSMYDSAQIEYMSGSAQIELFGEAVICNARSAKKIVLNGYNTVIVHKSDESKLGLVMNKESNLVILPDNMLPIKPTFKEFAMRYGIETKRLNAILYKAVHKKDGKYFSDKMDNFEYKIGETKEHEIDNQIENSCAKGLHVSAKFWAVRFGSDWSDRAILECQVPIKNIIVAKDTDGKVRTSKLKVIREVPKEEY